MGYIFHTCVAALTSFGTLASTSLLVFSTFGSFASSSFAGSRPLCNCLEVVTVSLLTATTAVVVPNTLPPPLPPALFAVLLLFKFPVAVKEVTYIEEFFMKPFSSSPEDVV